MDGIGLLILMCLGAMFGPPLIFAIIGASYHRTNRDRAKLFYIIATAWLVIGLGICASLLLAP